MSDPLHATMDLVSQFFNKTVLDYVVAKEQELGETHGSGFVVSWTVQALRAAGAPLAAAQVRARHNAAAAATLGKNTHRDAAGVATTTEGVGNVNAKMDVREVEKVVDAHTSTMKKKELESEPVERGESRADAKKGGVSAQRRRLREHLAIAVRDGRIAAAHLQLGKSRLDSREADASALSRKVSAPKLSSKDVKAALGGGSIGFRGTEALSVLANHAKMWGHLGEHQHGAEDAVSEAMEEHAERLQEVMEEITAVENDVPTEVPAGGDEDAVVSAAETAAGRLTELEVEKQELRDEMVKLAADMAATRTGPEGAVAAVELPEKLKLAMGVFDALATATWPWVTGHEFDPSRPKQGYRSEHRADPAQHGERVKPLCNALINAGLDGTASHHLHHLIAHEGQSRRNFDSTCPGCTFSCQGSEHANKLFKQQAMSLFYMLRGWRGDSDRTMFAYIMRDRMTRLLYFCDTIPKKRNPGKTIDGS